MIKTDLRNMSESIGSLDGKTKQNCLKMPKFPLKKKKKNLLYLLKTKNTNRFYIVKINVLTNFICLRLKVRSEIGQKVVDLDLRTALNVAPFILHFIFIVM